MSKLSELINKLCPNGVEYKKLGEIGAFYSGLTGKTKDDFKDGNAKFITYMNIYSNPSLKIDVLDRVKIFENEKQNTVELGDVLFTGSSETPDECGMSSVLTKVSEEPLYLNSFCFGFRLFNKREFLPDFLKHLFRSSELRKQIKRTASGVTRFNVSKVKMAEVKIPLPPLEIQREVVEILDKFAQLTAELTAELQKRKKQYEHYRRALLGGVESGELKVESGYQMVKLGDVCDFVYGYTDKAKDVGDARFIRITDINDGGHLNRDGAKYITLNSEAKKFLLRKGDLLMARTGATYGKTLYYDSEEPAVYASFLIRVIPDDMRLNNRFYWHFSQSTLYWDQAKRLVTAGGQPQFNVGAISQVSIPLPPLAEQERIVAILDRFDSLCNSLTEGLPAEIELRKKQYEYYRDKLLSFEKAS